MSWFYTLANGPCLLSSNGSELIGIKNYYRSILCTTYTHTHELYRAYVLRFLYEWRWSMAETNIALSGNWDGGSLHACHIVNRTYRCTIHISQMKIVLHTTINHWTTLRNLHGDICLNRHIYYIMSGRYDKVHFCNVAADHKWKWVIFSTSHNNQPYSNVIRKVRWEIVDG